ncbi:hypothetical protein HD806DRAFT_511614 [Xylariaceae sp. AK1471]|nr:hypothetical protein HD806DRAFT_511614 [Xylariaceae sp. AK1471]
MAQQWHEAPEVATSHQSFPEVYYPAPVPEAVPYSHGENLASIPLKPFNDAATFIEPPKSSYPGTNSFQTYDNQSTRDILPPIEPPRETPKRVCGCSILVLLLSTFIALLSITVIGLAAGTGIQTNRANNAESRLATLMSNLSNIDRGCSANPDAVTATSYTSKFFSRPTYQIYCNNDAPNPPLQSFFVGNFDDCMDACASYSAYTPGNFPNNTIPRNSTCSGVSFIPDWTNRTTAVAGNAPGNCYLKPGPQNTTALTHPNSNGPAVHAAIIQMP